MSKYIGGLEILSEQKFKLDRLNIIRRKAIKTTVDFKIGQLKTLENQLFEISEENKQLIFHIEGS